MKLLNIIRIISFPFRYGIVLGLAKVLTPALFKEVFNPIVYSELRPMICFVKATQKKQLLGAEIGVFKGHHAFSMLSNLPLKTLYLVDPYVPFMQDGNLVNPIYAKKIAIQTLKKFDKRTAWVQSAELPNNLDFIYIDGDHSYEAVKKDIKTYYDKVRKGGVIGGHDYCNRFQGVIKAVSEFAAANNLDLFVEQADWWIQNV